jgi:hypothetical protein
LYKFQWDQIHDPGKVDGLFESDNSGLLTNGNLDDEHTHFDKKFKSPTVYFLTPGHTVFGVVDDEHFSEPGFYSRYRNKGIPRGVLINFWYHGLYYVAKYSNDFKTFLGYVAEGIQDNNLYLDDRDVIIPPDGTEVDVQMGDEGDGCIYSFYKIRPKISKDGMAGGTGQYGHIYSEETFNEAIYPRFGFEKSENQCVLCGSPNRSYLINNLIKAFGNMDLFGTFDGDAIHIIEEQLKKINDGVDIANEDFRTKICAEERYKIIKKLCIGFFTRTIGDDEKVVVKLIELTPDVQVIEFLNFLKNDDDGLLSSLEDKMHGDEYVQYHLALNSLYRKSEGLGVYAKINALDQYTETPEVHYRMNHRTFIWSDYRFIKRFVNLLDRSVVQINYDIDINDEGKIDVDIEIPSMMSARASTTIQDPFELVKVIFLTDAGSLGYNAGDSAYIPAINLLVLGNDQFKGEMIDLINVAFIIGSAGSGAAFSSVGGAFWTSISAVSLVISSYQASIGQSQEGRDFLAAWDVLNKALLVYQTYRIVTAIPSAISSVRSAFARFKVKNPSGAASVETELNQALTQAEQVAGNPEGLSGRIRNYSSLKTKFEQLEQIKKTEFLRDFVAASDELLNALDKEVELFEVWKKWGNKGVIELEELRAFQKVWKKSTRDVTFDNFYERTAYQMSKVAQLAKPGYNKFMPELYAAWEAKNVAEMENIFRKYGLDPLKIYPPCEGAWRFPQTRTPSINDQFDRFQYGETLYGSNASPVENGASYTISSRALIENYYFPTAEEAAKGYYYFKFRIKTTTAASFEYGEVMPWAGKQGGGMQVKSSVKFNDMLVTEEIEILEKFKYDVTSDTWIQIQ